MSVTPIWITSFYDFTPLSEEQVAQIKGEFEALAAQHHLRGLCLIGPEGINATISGSEFGIARTQDFIQRAFATSSGDPQQNKSILFKYSQCAKHPFHNFQIKIKEEIVTLGVPGLVPDKSESSHLEPVQWKAALANPETVVLDTRNRYEFEVGKFENAIDFNMREFNEFPEKLRQSELPKDKQILIYCTGGIRCEKAVLEMRRQGYENVAQLKGGILEYLREFPDQEFKGDCFVFDYRVAVDQHLRPADLKFCPHCGQPANQIIACSKCGSEAIVCSHCMDYGAERLTCSKNCAHHARIGSNSSKPHQQELIKRHRVSTPG